MECYSNLIIGKTISDVVNKKVIAPKSGEMSPSMKEVYEKKNSEEVEKSFKERNSIDISNSIN